MKHSDLRTQRTLVVGVCQGYSGQSKLDDSFDDFDYDNDWNKGREKKKQKKYRRR